MVLRIPVVEPFGYKGLDRAIFIRGDEVTFAFPGGFLEFLNIDDFTISGYYILLVSVSATTGTIFAQAVLPSYHIVSSSIVDHCIQKKKVPSLRKIHNMIEKAAAFGNFACTLSLSGPPYSRYKRTCSGS